MAKAFWLVLLAVVLSPSIAHAQAAPLVMQIDAVTDQIKAQTSVWGPALMAFARNTFMMLALIETAWAFIELGLRRGGSLDDVLQTIVAQILFFGFFLWLLELWLVVGPALIDSIRYAARVASGQNFFSPGEVFAGGVRIAGNVMAKLSIFAPEQSIGLFIAGLILIVCYACIAARMIEALVDGYFVVAAGMLFMAAGATRWTKDIVISVIRTALAIGAELFVLQLITALGMTFINKWVNDFQTIDSTNLVTIIGLSLVLLVVTWRTPQRVASMIGGASMGGGSRLLGAGAAMGAAALGAWGIGSAAASSASGVVASAGQAASLANTQEAARIAGGGAKRGAMASAASFTGTAARNMASAYQTDVSRRLSGSGTSQGSASWRAAADLSNRNRMAREEMTKPTPRSSP